MGREWFRKYERRVTYRGRVDGETSSDGSGGGAGLQVNK
jgi:hypothetical protein